MSYGHFASINVNTISAADIQANAVNQVKQQLATARTRATSAVAKNVAKQKAPSVQIGDAHNKVRIRTDALRLDVDVYKISATNVQDNAANQTIAQKAVAVSARGYSLASNWDSQAASNLQRGMAYNRIGIKDPKAYFADVDVHHIDAVNQQTNAVKQTNLQEALSRTSGYRPDPALNTGFQAAVNKQVGLAYNLINIQV